MDKTSNQRPIIIRRIRKKGHGGHHGGAWKVAYADFVTAMMAFFMLLWLVSNPDKERLKGLAEYFTPASAIQPLGHNVTRAPSAGSSSSRAAPGLENQQQSGLQAGGGTADIPQSALRAMAEEMRLALEAGTDPETRAQVQVEPDRNGMRISLVDSAHRPMFRANTATLNSYARDMLLKVADKVRPLGAQVAIEGHTDAQGGQNSRNWRLSADRAMAAQTALLEGGLPVDRIAEVAAFAGAQPLFPDQPDRPENRRINIVVLAGKGALPSDVSFRF